MFNIFLKVDHSLILSSNRGGLPEQCCDYKLIYMHASEIMYTLILLLSGLQYAKFLTYSHILTCSLDAIYILVTSIAWNNGKWSALWMVLHLTMVLLHKSFVCHKVAVLKGRDGISDNKRTCFNNATCCICPK